MASAFGGAQNHYPVLNLNKFGFWFETPPKAEPERSAGNVLDKVLAYFAIL